MSAMGMASVVGPSLDVLVSGLEAKRNGAGWKALCPVHADRNPSLTITERDGGQVLVHCHAGCDQRAVVDALRGMGLWPEPGRNGRLHGTQSPERATVTRYEYRNAVGALVAIHKRVDLPNGDKSMPWLKPDGTNSSGAIKPEQLPLYRLPDLLAAPGDAPVYLVEGEKACDAARAAGLISVSLAGGASQRDFGSALEPLRGRHVVLWPDNDDAGRALMRRVHGALKGTAATVRLLAVPDLPEKGDAFDFFRAKRTVDELAHLAAADTSSTKNVSASGDGESAGGVSAVSPERSGASEAKNLTKGVTPPADILSANGEVPWAQLGCRLGSEVVPEDVRWLWEERLALGKLNLIEGDGGEGKSLVIDDLAARLSANLPLPDGSPNPFGEQVKVVLLMAEDDAADTIIPRILAGGGDPSNIIVLDHVPDEDGGHFPTIPDDLDHIERVVKAAGARMLAIDPLASYLSEAVNSHNDHSVRRALATLPGLAARNECAVVVVRHLNKNTAADPKHRGSGAGAFINLARIGLAIGPDPDDSTGARRILAVNKVNIGEQAGALAYHIDTAWVRKSEQDEALIKTARVVWDGPSTLTAADILGAKPDEETRTASEIAKDLLLQLLTEDAQDEEPVWAAVKKAGVSHSSYMRARKALGVKASRVGGLADQGKWQLALPKRTPQIPPSGPDILRPANERDILRQTTSLPDRETPAQPPKNVTRTGDILSELSGRSAAPPDTCEQPGCVRRPNAVDRGRWVCFSHHPLGSAAATTNGRT